MFKLSMKIGRQTLTCEGNDVKMLHKFGAIYGALPHACDNCKSDNIYLSYKSPKGNDYYMMACKDCGAELNFHQKKEGGFFIKQDEKMVVYKNNNKNTEKKPVDIVKDAVDDIPEKDTQNDFPEFEDETIGDKDVPF